MGAANFARRSPWPMINILRTPQVRAAQKGVPTGQVYKQNEERLSEVGTTTLEVMLYYIKLYYIILHSNIFYSIKKFIVLYYIILYYIMLYSDILCYIMLYYKICMVLY